MTLADVQARFPVGSKCMRHMGIGVWWIGTVKRITEDARVVVLFSADANGGISCPFEADEHLIPAPTMPSEAAELLEKIEAELQENAELIDAVSRPQWPVGYFGPENRPPLEPRSSPEVPPSASELAALRSPRPFGELSPSDYGRLAKAAKSEEASKDWCDAHGCLRLSCTLRGLHRVGEPVDEDEPESGP